MRCLLVLCAMSFISTRIEPLRVRVDFWVLMDMMDEVGGIGPPWDDFSPVRVLLQRQSEASHVLPEWGSAHRQADGLG